MSNPINTHATIPLVAPGPPEWALVDRHVVEIKGGRIPRGATWLTGARWNRWATVDEFENAGFRGIKEEPSR
jgi:hypothetical protein